MLHLYLYIETEKSNLRHCECKQRQQDGVKTLSVTFKRQASLT